jgi:hypothetical protein
MRYEIDLKNIFLSPVYSLGEDFSGASPKGDTLSFNN